MQQGLTVAAVTVAAVVAAGGIATWLYHHRNTGYFTRGMARVWAAGYTERQADVNGAVVNYAEGPDNGPALLLIHGQGTDWKSYYPVLPALATSFHVFAVDVYGHGRSSHEPELYTNVRVGTDLTAFVSQVIGTPAIVSGHSSGGLVATWMAAAAPQWVQAAVLEDPPLLTTTLPRARSTWNWVDLATTCHDFLASGQDDFVAHQFEKMRLWDFFNGRHKGFIRAGLAYHADNPGRPILVWTLPPAMNESYRGMPDYDPRFGDAFYTDSWDTGWEHATTMREIRVPVTYLHAKVSVGTDGILQGATSDAEAAEIAAAIPGARFVQTGTGHNIHGEDADGFVAAVTELRARVAH